MKRKTTHGQKRATSTQVKKKDRVYDEQFHLLAVDTIAPLYKSELLSGHLDIVGAMEHFFNVDYREIYHLEFPADCRLHGCKWTEEGDGGRVRPPRFIKANTAGLLRFDTRSPERFEIEVGTSGEKTSSYVLTFHQFHDFKKHLTLSYRCRLTGKDPTHARRLKRYHDEFVQRHFGVPLTWITASGLARPGYKKTGRNGSGDGV